MVLSIASLHLSSIAMQNEIEHAKKWIFEGDFGENYSRLSDDTSRYEKASLQVAPKRGLGTLWPVTAACLPAYFL